MRTIRAIAIALTVLTAHADQLYLFTTSSNVAVKVCAAIDTALGYPNPATATLRAVNPILHTNGNWWLVPLPEALYSPKVKKALELRGLLPASRKDDLVIDTVAEAQAKLADIKAAGTADNAADNFAIITTKVAESGGFFTKDDTTTATTKPADDVKALDVIK